MRRVCSWPPDVPKVAIRPTGRSRILWPRSARRDPYQISAYGLVILSEIRDSHAHHVFDNDDFAKADERTSNQHIDILSSRTWQRDHLPSIQREYLPER